jgi:glycosyltransferase involved in cell wall biosynthesis
LKTRVLKDDSPAMSNIIGTIDETTDEIEIKEAKLSVIIPAYNEAKMIAEVVSGSLRYADEVVVVDDGSTDNTSLVARAAGAKVIRLPKNKGKGFALALGLYTAAINDADVIVCLDGDGQHNPDEIPIVSLPIVRGEADLVIGSRYLESSGSREMPGYRQFGQSVLSKAANVGNGGNGHIKDSLSGFRALSRKAVLQLELTEEGMGIESEMLMDAAKLDMKIKEVPITCKYRGLTTSKFTPGKLGMRILTSILRTLKDEHPMLYFGVGGLVLMLIGTGVGLYCLYSYIYQSFLPFLPTFGAVLLFIVGMISMFSGVILSSLADKKR